MKDHLGNSRIVANQHSGVVQSTQYYPFGMAFADGSGQTAQPYKYNGKELYTAQGLNLYDYSARYMEPALGRFTTMDPLAEKYYAISPYAYCANNPMRFVDPTGMDYTDYRTEQGELLYKTDDDLVRTVVIPDSKLELFEEKLNELNEKEKINDSKSNTEELHILGVEILDLKNLVLTGDGSSPLDLGLASGYKHSYENGDKNAKLGTWLLLTSWMSPEQASIYTGYVKGRSYGVFDASRGAINKFSPFSSLKDNKPLIELK